MEWIQALSIMATVIVSAYYIHREIQMDIRAIRDDIKAQSSRTDKLYEMFIELRKDMDERFQKTDQKFYDLLKEKK